MQSNQSIRHSFYILLYAYGALSKIIRNLKTGTGSSYSVFAANGQYKLEKRKFGESVPENARFMDTGRFSIA